MTFTERGNNMGVIIKCKKDQIIEDLKKENLELFEEIKRLCAKVVDLQADKAILKKQNENGGRYIEELEGRNETLNKQHKNQRDTIVELLAEVESLKNENAKLSAGWADFDALYDKLNSLGSERDQAIKEKVRLEVIRDGLLKENQRLKDDRTYLHTELAKRGETIEALKKVIDLYGSAIGYQEKRKG